MNNEELRKKSLELLATEESLINHQKKGKKKLPDLEAAKKRVEHQRKRRITGIVMLAAAAALFLFVRPALSAYRDAMDAQYGFALLPELLQLVFWCAFILLVLWGIAFALSKANQNDLKVQDTYRANQKYNEDLAAAEKELLAKWQEQVDELNRLAGTTYGAANPRYFFQIPFDGRKTFRDFKDGREFYSDALRGGDLVEPLGNSFTAGPPFIHKWKSCRNLRFDGFYTSKICKPEEALSLFQNHGYITLFEDSAYLEQHQEENCRLFCIYDEFSLPVENRGFFKMKEMDLDSVLRALSATWTDAQKFLASGISAYDKFIGGIGSSAADKRDESSKKYAEKLNYGDIVAIEEGRDDDFRLVHAKTTKLLEKGYILTDNSNKKILYIGLTNKHVYLPEIAFNCSQYEEKDWDRYHGWICGAGVGETKVKPDKSSTIDYVCNYLNKEFSYFDPFEECPEGLSDDQYRLWIAGWGRCYRKQQEKAGKKAV